MHPRVFSASRVFFTSRKRSARSGWNHQPADKETKTVGTTNVAVRCVFLFGPEPGASLPASEGQLHRLQGCAAPPAGTCCCKKVGVLESHAAHCVAYRKPLFGRDFAGWLNWTTRF